MELKDLNTIQRSDRYTADGRDAIIKASTVEDRRYKPGEISEATGLQKQPDGSWAPPKNGAGKATGSESTTKHDDIGHEIKESIKAAQYYERQARNFQPSDPSYNRYMEKSKQYMKEAEQKSDENGFNFEEFDGAKREESAKPQMEKFSATTQIESGKHDDALRDTMGDNEAIEDLARDIVGNTEKLSPERQAEVAERVAGQLRDRYKALERDASRPQQEEKPAARRESVNPNRMYKDLDGNFWSRPEDFKQDIESHGWDVEEMNNEYAVISNDRGSQYEVRFDDHSDDGDLTVRTFKPLMVDEDDDDELEDAAPAVRKLTGDTKIRVRR